MENGGAGSELSFGSIISLQSVDDSPPYQEKPKHVKKSKSRDQSPYDSSGGITNQSTKSVSKRYTGHEAWSAAIRNGFTGLSSENSPANRMLSPQVQWKSRSSLGRSFNSNGPFSRDEHVLASGKPAYKSQEDYYDEVLELKQVIKNLKTDNGVLKTKLQRIMQENVLKDRKIKDFLNPNKQPEEIRRTLTDKNADSSAVVSSLKQKLHLMERNVKDKESELRKLKSDLKSTNVDELRIQMETYYEETQRLQTVLSSVYSQLPGTRNISDTRSNQSRTSSRINSPRRGGLEPENEDQLQQIRDENRRLESENQSLKKDLLCAIDGQRDKTLKEKKVDYADMNRVQMLRKIGELEQFIEEAKAKHKNEPKASRKHSLEDPETELRKQREVIENLKQDRTHYRKEAEKLRAKLEAAEDEIRELKDLIRKTNAENKEKLREVNDEWKLKVIETKEQSQATESASQPTPKQQGRTNSLQRKKISFQDDIVEEENLLSRKEDEAARVLQRNWRKYHHQNSKAFDKETKRLAVVQIQSAFRAHAIRRQRIQLLSDAQDDAKEDLEWEDAVTRVQSAMRAHHVRRKYYSNKEKCRDQSSSEHTDESDTKDKQEKKKIFKQQSFLKKTQTGGQNSESKNVTSLMINKENESDDESDDDVIIGGSRLNLRTARKKSPTPRDEAPVMKQMSLNSVKARHSGDRHNDVNSEDSDDDVQISTKFGKSIQKSKTPTRNENKFSFGDSARKKEVDEQRLRNVFGKENKETNFSINKGAKNESSLDNFFTSSRTTKARQQRFENQAGSEPESEANVGGKTEIVNDEKPKKSLFSWGSSRRNASKNVPVPVPRKKITSGNKETSKSTNVWSSRPTQALGDDDDDDDDVVVTPKILRKNPTKTASLLDELF